MSPSVLKGVGIGCFVVCAILLFVAWERYQDNANKVEAMNNMVGGMAGQLMGQLTGGANWNQECLTRRNTLSFLPRSQLSVESSVCSSAQMREPLARPNEPHRRIRSASVIAYSPREPSSAAATHPCVPERPACP